MRVNNRWLLAPIGATARRWSSSRCTINKSVWLQRPGTHSELFEISGHFDYVLGWVQLKQNER
jgi:hypothetical protein